MAISTLDACNFLERLQRFDLSMLLRSCAISIEDRPSSSLWFTDSTEEVIIVRAPEPVGEAVRSLSPDDRKRIAQAVIDGQRDEIQHEDIRVEKLDGASVARSTALLSDLLIHRAMMIDVATGGKRIQEVDDFYRAREVRIRELIPEGFGYNNPHSDLWAWYRHWSEGLPQYKDRRFYVRQLFKFAIEAVAKRPLPASEPREVTGWERVDRALFKAQAQLQTASAEEDYQAIGLLCREIIISLAQAVYDPAIHESVDGVWPSETDANRMLEAYVVHTFSGASNKEVRAHHRASLALALNLQHRRTATRQLAALCVEATASTTAVISIIARDGDDVPVNR